MEYIPVPREAPVTRVGPLIPGAGRTEAVSASANRYQVVGRVACITAIGLVFLLFLATLTNTAGAIGQPFGGLTFTATFLVNENPAPGAPKLAAFQPGDRVVLIDGQSPLAMQQVYAQAADARRPVIYTVLRRNSTGVLAPVLVFGGTTSFRLGYWLQVYAAGLLLGLVWWALGTFLYAVGAQRVLHRIFLLLSLFISSLILTDLNGTYSYQPTPLEPVLYGPLFGLLMPFAGAALIRLAFYFPLPKPLMVSHPSWQYWPYALAALIGVPNMIDTAGRLHPLPVTATQVFDVWSTLLDRSALLYPVVGALVLLGGAAYDRLRAQDPVVRRQVRLVGLGLAVGGAPLVLGELLPISLGIPAPVTGSQGYLFLIAAPVALAYAIVRYRLFDVSRVLQLGAVYLGASSILVALYLVMVRGLQALLSEVTGQSTDIVAIVSTLGIALLFAPLVTRAQRAAERVLFRERFLLRQALREFGARAAALTDLDPLAGALVDETSRLLRVEAAALLLCRERVEDRVYLDLLRQRNSLLDWPEREVAVADSWVQATIATPVAVDLDLPGPRARETAMWDILRRAGVGVVLPLVAGGELVGILLLGRKRNQAGFLREELDVLEAIAGQAALALRNAQLLRDRAEQERLRSELDIARRIQRNLLPAELPRLPGLDLAAMCLPARETSGDSYDVVVDDHGALHIVVSDACGKSVPAALLIALSRNTLRGALTRTTAPAAALTETNRILAPDLDRRQYLAVGITSIDPQVRSLRLANAGQVYPLLARPSLDGAAPEHVFLESPLPRLPLGIQGDLVYQEVRAALQPGDLLVCYTDGLVEAAKSSGELFGFERLGALVGAAAQEGTSAAETLARLLSAVTEWSDQEMRSDDITIVVARVL